MDVLDELLIVLTGEFGCLPSVGVGDRQYLLTDAITLYKMKRSEYEDEFALWELTHKEEDMQH